MSVITLNFVVAVTIIADRISYRKEDRMPAIFERSLIKMGAGGLVITLPKSWTRYYNLKAGDKLEVIADGKLIIRPIRKTTNHIKIQE